MREYKQVLREISKHNSVASRKKIIIQSGGQLMSILIPSAIALIETIVRNIVDKK